MAELGEVLDDDDMDLEEMDPPDYDLGMDLNLYYTHDNMSSATDSTIWSVKKDQQQLKVTLDGARSTAWKNGQKEIKFIIREKVRHLVGKKKVTVSLLLDLVFGKESEMFLAFSTHIHISHETFLRFLGVFLLGACHHKSCTQMYGDYSFIRSHVDTLLPISSYVDSWDRISKANLPAALGQTTFWLSFQSAFNAFCRKIFIVGTNENELRLSIILDDDKVHYESNKADSDGLKVIRHVNDVVETVSGYPNIRKRNRRLEDE